jgi:hypothetical protein
MLIQLRALVLLQSAITWQNSLPHCPALVTAVWPGEDGNTETENGPVMVDVIGFPNGQQPRSVQRVRVFDLRSQVANDDLHGVAYVTDDLAEGTVVPKPPVTRRTSEQAHA